MNIASVLSVPDPPNPLAQLCVPIWPLELKFKHSVLPGSAEGSVSVNEAAGLVFDAFKVTVLLPDELFNMIAPVFVLLVPSVRALAPWTVNVPVRLAAEEIVWLLIVPEPVDIFALLVLIPPGSEVVTPLRPSVKPVAFVVPILIVPAVVAAVPASILMLPDAPPLELPERMVRVEVAPAASAVLSSVPCKAVPAIKVPDTFTSPVCCVLDPAVWASANVPSRFGSVSVRLPVGVPVIRKLVVP